MQWKRHTSQIKRNFCETELTNERDVSILPRSELDKEISDLKVSATSSEGTDIPNSDEVQRSTTQTKVLRRRSQLKPPERLIVGFH